MALQVLFTGWCECELWNLDVSVAKNIRIRLEAFRDMPRHGIPNGFTEEAWEDVLNRMIRGFSVIEKCVINETPDEYREASIALELFTRYMRALWD